MKKKQDKIFIDDIEIFEHEVLGRIRGIVIGEDIWFVGKDIADALGYKETTNMRKLLRKEEYRTINPQTLEFTGFFQKGRTQLETNPN